MRHHQYLRKYGHGPPPPRTPCCRDPNKFPKWKWYKWFEKGFSSRASDQEYWIMRRHKYLHCSTLAEKFEKACQCSPLLYELMMLEVVRPAQQVFFMEYNGMEDHLTMDENLAAHHNRHVLSIDDRWSDDEYNDIYEASLADEIDESIFQFMSNRCVCPAPPLIIDSGASISICGDKDAFVTKLQTLGTDLQSLTGKVETGGKGIVRWNMRDDYGVSHEVLTTAFYVPGARVNLMSPQTYFKEIKGGKFIITSESAKFYFADGSPLTIDYHPASNIPELSGTVHRHGEDDNVLWNRGSNARYGMVNQAVPLQDENNANMSRGQRHQMHWHCRLGHVGFQTLQKMMRVHQEGKMPRIPSGNTNAAQCKPPLCRACLRAKQHRRGDHSSTERRRNNMAIHAEDLLPGQCVSMDQ